MRCADCRWEYPGELLNMMVVNDSRTLPICGICALARSNELAGRRQQRRAFQGEIAESLRQRAIGWRAAHPHAAPRN